MFQDVQKYIKNCESCLQIKYKRDPYQISYNLTLSPNYPFDILHVDTSALKNKYLTQIDAFS